MKSYLRVIFKDDKEGKGIDICGYSKSNNKISLYYKNPVENNSGFIIVNEENKIVDCTKYKYRWDVIDQKENMICYTDNQRYQQTEPWSDLSDVPQYEETLSNEELTEAVADLMYEVSMAQLGI